MGILKSKKEGIYMKEWSLQALYSGYDDPRFIQDQKDLDVSIAKLHEKVSLLCEDNGESLIAMLQATEENCLLFERLAAFISLRQSANTTDEETVSLMNQLTQKGSTTTKAIATFDKYIANIEDLDALIAKNTFLQGYAYLLKRTKEDAKYSLSNDVEEVIAKMNLSGGGAWGDMQAYLTSTLEVAYQGECINLSQIRNYAYADDAQVRKSAYEAELAAFDKIKDAVAFSLNSIKSQVSMLSDLRGYASPLDMTLYQSRMKRETLDVMMSTIEKYLPKFQAYLKRKAELLGHKNGLPWYDLFAPLGESTRKFSVEESKEYLLKHFRPFAQDMADMIETAYDDEWIDFFPRKGKVGGAFCYNLPFIKQNRVLTNFDGSLGDVVTLAHELGHAYHGMMIQDHNILNTRYSMPVAETASTFNENIIMNAAIEEASGKEKVVLIESQLQDLAQIMCDIYSRFLFEKAVFEKTKTEFMFPNALEQLMLDAQKKAYGDGLDSNYLHPYMWLLKSHYYSSDLSFYNFPYAFGGLFARGLIVKYQKEGASFVPKYRELLRKTTVSDVEDVALMADIDLTQASFWEEALTTCANRIDEFLELTK